MSALSLQHVGQILTGEVIPLSAEGFEVGALTWRDVGVAWPYPFVSSREEAAEADSVGIHVKGEGAEGLLVFFAGGWADVSFFSEASTDVFIEAPQATSETEVREISERFASFFRLQRANP